MRIAANDVQAILRNPAATHLVLLYGDDLGLVRERAACLASAVLGVSSDPFRLSILTREEHPRLAEEAQALSLVGGRRVVRLLDASDAVVPTLARLRDTSSDVLIILEAGALTARSKLRLKVESQRDWAAIPCYPATPAMIVSQIIGAAAAAHCAVSASVSARLAGLLPADTGARTAELQKLCTYVGPGGVIDDQAVDLCVEDGSELSIGELLDAVFGGDADRTSSLFQQHLDDGITGAGTLAMLGNHLHRLLKLRMLLDSGVSAQAACAMLIPPASPRQAASLLRQVRRWPQRRLIQLQDSIKAADQACKRAGARDMAIAGRLVLAAAASVGLSTAR